MAKVPVAISDIEGTLISLKASDGKLLVSKIDNVGVGQKIVVPEGTDISTNGSHITSVPRCMCDGTVSFVGGATVNVLYGRIEFSQTLARIGFRFFVTNLISAGDMQIGIFKKQTNGDLLLFEQKNVDISQEGYFEYSSDLVYNVDDDYFYGMFPTDTSTLNCTLLAATSAGSGIVTAGPDSSLLSAAIADSAGTGAPFTFKTTIESADISNTSTLIHTKIVL